MKRRDFLKKAGLGAAAAAVTTAGVVGCGEKKEEKKVEAPAVVTKKTYNWRMVTTWPPKLPVLQDGCERLAKRIEELSDGRIKIQVFAAGELVPALESFQSVPTVPWKWAVAPPITGRARNRPRSGLPRYPLA